jgi:low temperature requirement protein LtrA
VDAAAPEKRVTWAELFFDLVFAFAITQVSGLLHADHSAAGLLRATIVFVPIYWAWVGTTMHANTHDVDTVTDRLGVFAVGVASLFMALAVPLAFEDRGVLFGASYLAARIVLAGLVFRGVFARVPINSFSVGVCVTGPLLLVGGLLEGRARIALWLAAAAVDLVVPRLVRARLAALSFDRGHLPERFGQFLIIALGESVVAVGAVAAAQRLTGLRLIAVAAAYALAFGLWWVYFHFAAGAMRYAMANAAVPTEVIRSVLSYGHLLFIGGIVALSVGLAEAIGHPGERLGRDAVGLLYGGTALYLASFGYTRWRMFRAVSYSRLGAAAICLALLPLAWIEPAVVSVLVLVVLVASVNIVEARWVRRAWPAPTSATDS